MRFLSKIVVNRLFVVTVLSPLLNINRVFPYVFKGTPKSFILFSAFFLWTSLSLGSMILVPMDADSQENHLKAYGITYWVLTKQQKVQWLLNYRGGSFLLPDGDAIRKECKIRGVSFEVISDNQAEAILEAISSPSQNQEAVILEKAPKIAVYSPKENQPWDDAVTMVLTYAEIPYSTVYDEEVLTDQLALYDWLHLHHEDLPDNMENSTRGIERNPGI